MSLLSLVKKNGQKDSNAKRKSGKADVKKKETEKESVSVSPATGRIGLQPLVTEKSVNLQASVQTVAFRVRPQATKSQIVSAFEDRYQVHPVDVRTMNMSPKTRQRGKTSGRTANWKKAYITLPKGKSIEFGV